MIKPGIPRRLLVGSLWLTLATPATAASVSSAFACSTDEPYATIVVEQLPGDKVRLDKVNGDRRETIAVRTGSLHPGQSLQEMRRGDAFAVPLVRDGRPVVDLLVGGRVVGSFPGQFHGLTASRSGKALLQVITGAVTEGESAGRQVLLDADGEVLGDRPVKVHIEEGHGFALRFTEAGDALYVHPNMHVGAASIEVVSADGRFDTLFEARLGGVTFRDVVMVDAQQGFTIGGRPLGGGNHLFRVDRQGFASLGRKGDQYRPELMEVDSRAGRLLVRGAGGYTLHDLDGNRLADRFGYLAGGRPYAPDVRLALDGSVAEYRLDGTLVFREASTGYRVGVAHKLDLQAWNAAQCLTTRSIAFRRPDGRMETKLFD